MSDERPVAKTPAEQAAELVFAALAEQAGVKPADQEDE